jgi:hypothetical protein
MQNGGKIGGHRFQKVGQIFGDILREGHLLRKNNSNDWSS